MNSYGNGKDDCVIQEKIQEVYIPYGNHSGNDDDHPFSSPSSSDTEDYEDFGERARRNDSWEYAKDPYEDEDSESDEYEDSESDEYEIYWINTKLFATDIDGIMPDCPLHNHEFSDEHPIVATHRSHILKYTLNKKGHNYNCSLSHDKGKRVIIFITPNNQILFVYVEDESYDILAKITFTEFYTAMYKQPNVELEDGKWISSVVEQSWNYETCAFENPCDTDEKKCIYHLLERNEGKILEKKHPLFDILGYDYDKQLWMIKIKPSYVGQRCRLPIIDTDRYGINYSMAYMRRSWIEKSSIGIYIRDHYYKNELPLYLDVYMLKVINDIIIKYLR